MFCKASAILSLFAKDSLFHFLSSGVLILREVFEALAAVWNTDRSSQTLLVLHLQSSSLLFLKFLVILDRWSERITPLVTARNSRALFGRR